MRNKFGRIIALVICIFTLLGNFTVFGASSYSSYTYSINGDYLLSPDAYIPHVVIDSEHMGLDMADTTPLADPNDIETDEFGNVYISESGANRIVVLDPYYKKIREIAKFTNHHGVADSLNGPEGLCVKGDKIYVCDSENNRIVIFKTDGSFYKIVEEPESDVFPANSIYKPVAVAVDDSGRLYIVSSTTYMGVIAMTEDGVFQGFIGAQKVTPDVLDIIWRRFETEEQRSLGTQYIPTEFNNITIDERGFLFVTTSSIDESTQQSAIESKSKSGEYAPVKKLNSSGDDIMNRSGFYPPSGEVDVRTMAFDEGAITGASRIIDVALGDEGTWSIIDEKRQRIFTYDEDGNLLFAFGDNGTQLGNLVSIEAITYQGSNMLVLDKNTNSFTVYRRTEYGEILIEALRNQNERQYDKAVEDWQNILQRNNNFDVAYIGIGKALYRSGDYEESMEYFKHAYDTANYSTSFKMWRQEWVSKYILVIPVVVIAFFFGLSRLFKYANKVNKATALKLGKRTFKEEILYAFHLIMHPFDGFWDLKHEKRGSVRGGLFYILLTIITFSYQSIGTSYMFSPDGTTLNILAQVISVILPLMLWVIANWCLTTLFDGEGTIKDIFIATSYSLAPIPLLVIPATLLTNVLTLAEGQVVTMLISVAWVWAGMLIFFGMLVTHDYTIGKSIITSAGTIVGMAFIMFVGILFSSLLGKMIGFISSIVLEMSYRM